MCNGGEDARIYVVDFRDHFAAAKWIRKYLHYSKKSFGGKLDLKLGADFGPGVVAFARYDFELLKTLARECLILAIISRSD